MTKNNLDNVKWQGRFAHQKAVLFDEGDFNSKGTKLQVIKIQPKSKIEPHYHKVRTEAFYVLSGSGLITLDDKKLNCSANDYVLCAPGTIHAFENTAEEDFVVAVFRTNDPGDIDMIWVPQI